MLGEFVAGLGSGLVNAIGNFASARMVNKFSERMSSTSMQRRVKDLNKAGLNPGLAYSLGGASSPSGASADLGSAVTSGLQAASAKAQLSNLKRQNENIYADTLYKIEQAKLLKYGTAAKTAGTSAAEAAVDAAQNTVNSAKSWWQRLTRQGEEDRTAFLKRFGVEPW